MPKSSDKIGLKIVIMLSNLTMINNQTSQKF